LLLVLLLLLLLFYCFLVCSYALVDTVPIYLGSKRAKEIVNPESFFYCDSLKDLEELLVVENFSEERRKRMVETYKLTDEGIYQFSWHPDIAPIYNEKTGITVVCIFIVVIVVVVVVSMFLWLLLSLPLLLYLFVR
jgi:hypothetical protein